MQQFPRRLGPQNPAQPPSERLLRYDAEVRALSAAAPQPSRMWTYGPDPRHRIDVFEPLRPAGTRLPVVIFLHGGAWISGDTSWSRFIARPLATHPAILVAPAYRLAPEARWPAQHKDVVAAIRHVHDRLDAIGGDPDRVILAGHSAGGHLAAMACLSGEVPAPAACMAISSPFDLRYGDVPDNAPEARVYRYLLARRADDAAASPVLRVDGNRVPFHLCWGDRDMPHIRRAGGNMAAALQAVGTPVTTLEIAGADHFDMHTRLAEPGIDWYAALRRLIGHEAADPIQSHNPGRKE